MKKSLCLFALFIPLCFTQCGKKKPVKEETPDVTTGAFNINISPFPPADLQPSANDTQLVEFAWEEFFALNWRSSFSKNGLRDFPDTTWNFSDGDPDTVVWETYAHKTEFRPANGILLEFDTPPHYSYTDPIAQGQGASFTLFNNLDENNEIGSCDLYAHAKQYGHDYMVLYQAKVNRDEYNYIRENYDTPGHYTLKDATTLTANNLKKDTAYYPGGTSSCDCPPGVVCLPCGNPNQPGIIAGQPYRIGSIEVKTAWRRLAPGENEANYFTRNVIVYKSINGQLTYINETYGLIGLHIIHKTTNYPAFVFATWEHVNVEKDNMEYVELPSGPSVTDYPRTHPIAAVTDSSTAYAHRLLRKLNPKSVWLNYRLVGVQSVPTNDTTAFSFFLANYVVESDPQLMNFHGSNLGNPFNGQPNTVYDKQYISMGGCQGCHGVAQGIGGDFSFLVITPNVASPDTAGSGPAKFQRLLRLTAKK